MAGIGSIPGKAEALSAATHDKFLHFSAYFALSSLLFAGFTGSWLRRAAYTLSVIALLGGVDETIQHFLPYRKLEWLDWLFNMWAATLSVVLGGAVHTAVRARYAVAYLEKHFKQQADRTN